MRRRPWLLALLPLSGCGPAPIAGALFPLDAGHRWTYELRSEWESGVVETGRRVITTEGEDRLESGSAFRRRSADGVEWWLRADATGIYRVATKSDLDEAPKADPAQRFVLKAPVAVGTSWSAPTTAYLLRRRQEFPPEIRHSHPSIPMTYTIESLDDKVTVRAGSFERCVRVAGKAALKLFADPVVGWHDMPLNTIEWYCPGPGLVKLVREEPANSTFLVGGKQTLELSEWK